MDKDKDKNKDGTGHRLTMCDGLRLIKNYIEAHCGDLGKTTELHVSLLNPVMCMTSDGECHEGPILVCETGGRSSVSGDKQN